MAVHIDVGRTLDFDSKQYPYDPDFANCIRPDEVCGHRYAWPHPENSFGRKVYEAETGAVVEEVRPTVKLFRARVGGYILDRVADAIGEELDKRCYSPNDFPQRLIDELAEDAVGSFHGDYESMPEDAARRVIDRFFKGELYVSNYGFVTPEEVRHPWHPE